MTQLESYPRTTFFDAPPQHGVEQLPLSPLSLNLVRGIYLAQYYSQEDGDRAHFLGETASVELAYWTPEERDQYEFVQEEIETFFEINEGSQRMAANALAGYPFSEGRLRMEAVNEKALLIRKAWQGFQHRLPSTEELFLTPQFHEDDSVLRSTDYEASDRYDFMEFFISADIHAVRTGRLPGAFDLEPYESMVRELLIFGRPTGSRILDYWFKGCRQLMQRTGFNTHLALLSDQWEARHEGRRFMPDNAQ